MSNFPSQLDDDVTLPPVNDNITEVGAEAINACRDALLAIESEIGLGASGSAGSIAARLGVSLDPNGDIKPSAIAALGLVTLPIYNSQIADNAQIVESKLKLDFRTQDLFNYIKDLSRDVNEAINWIDIAGVKLDPHILGAIYKHELNHIEVTSNSNNRFKNKFDVLRDNTHSYSLFNDINSDLIQHQKADGTAPDLQDVITYGNNFYPSNYAHLAAGIFLNTSRFSTIPQTTDSLQAFAEFVDNASVFLYGTRIQNLYSNGISRTSRSSTLNLDGYGQAIIPPTKVFTYLLNNGSSSTPFDNIDTGDDIIEFKPDDSVLSTNLFDSKFALVKPGDIIRVNYGGVETSFAIKEKKYIQEGDSKKFIVRINGKNLFYTTNGSARIDKPLFNADKYGVLAVAAANNSFNTLPSLIVGPPRAALALGIGFEPDLLDNKHYLLYLALYPTGNPEDGYTILPGIDVTGNLGITPGAYTLESVIEATNNAFRKKGFNYRFIAFQYKGEFGIMLADSYNNVGFSIFNGVVNEFGLFDQTATDIAFPNNVVGLFGVNGKVAPDPLGFGANGAAVASPPYLGNYPTTESSLVPTKLFIPLKRNNYYVDGIEREKLNIDVGQSLDGYGDGYWLGEIVERVVFPNNRVKVTYRVNQDLSTSKIKAGKTIVVQSNGVGGLVDFGRFIIESVAIDTCTECDGIPVTDITVNDAIHATGISPSSSLATGNVVRLYFSSDSVEFNIETSTDITAVTPTFKRHFEVLTTSLGNVFTHERARFNINGSNITVNDVTLYGSSQLTQFSIVRVSPKLRGYKFFASNTYINKINLLIKSYSSTTGVYDGYLCMYDGFNSTRIGPTVTGRMGETVRFYDETNIDYIDFVFEFNSSSSFTSKSVDIQLFPTLQLDEEFMPIAICQVNDVTSTIGYLRDIREFGNVSEKQLSTSALNYLSSGDRLLHENGVIRGFDLTEDTGNPVKDQIRLKGGVALVNGNFVQMNESTVSIPIVLEYDGSFYYDVSWALCVNDKNEFQTIALFDRNTDLGNGNTISTPRVFKVVNANNGNFYNIDAMSFSDIVNKRKDLCILYVVGGASTFTTPVELNLKISDARKFVNDSDSVLPLKLTSDVSQGNFRDPIALLTWVRFNNAFNGRAIIKGANATITTPLYLNFNSFVTIEGENSASLTFNNLLYVGSNITFKDLTLTFNNGFSVVAGSNNITFDNCIININNTLSSSAPYFNYTGTNFSIKKCTITVNNPNAFLTKDVPIFSVSGSSKFKMEDSSVAVTYQSGGTPTDNYSGNIFDVSATTGTSSIEIYRSSFTGNFVKFMVIEPSTIPLNLKLEDCTINTSHVASQDSGYISNDFVNADRGIIYSKVSASLSDILINRCKFVFSPASATTQRLSFINFEMNNSSAVLKNVSVTNCQFQNTSTSDDRMPMFSVINTAAATNSATSPQPTAININVSNNVCDKNQSIIMTSTLKSVSPYTWMTYPGLCTDNCIIARNVCGTIGYYVSSGTRVNNRPTYTTINKGSSLIIEKNNCHYIANLSSTGEYFVHFNADNSNTTQINTYLYPSGHVKICDNVANWIHVSCAFEENSSLLIDGNSLNAYDTTFIGELNDGSSYITTILGYVVPTYKYAIVVNGNCPNINSFVPGVGNDAQVIISNNTTSTGNYINSLSVATTYEYGGYICALTSAQIQGNILKGIAEDTTATSGSVGINVNGQYNFINENRIYRNSKKIYAYINCKHPYSATPISSSTTFGNISNNLFDKSTNDDASDVTKAKNLPGSWTYDRNKNQ